MDTFCFGDSLTFGAYDGERGGWADRIRAKAMSGVRQGTTSANIFNLGICGETTRGLRGRLVSELNSRLGKGAGYRVILAYGANDAASFNGDFLVPVEEFVANLAWAIDGIRGGGGEVRLLNITPLSGAADDVLQASGRLRSNSNVNVFNNEILSLAKAKVIGLVDVNRAIDGDTCFSEDGLHLNARGHALMAKVISEQIHLP